MAEETTPITQAQIEDHAIQALLEVAPNIDTQKLDPAIAYHDQVDFDSVDFLSFVLALEKKLQVRVPETDYPKLSTLNGCVSYLAKILCD